MRKTTLTIVSVFCTVVLLAQYNEIGVRIGVANYAGELSEYQLRGQSYGPLIGVFGRRNFTKYLSIKASLLRAEISGYDKWAKSVTVRERNLNFRSDLMELAVTGECNLSPFNIRANQTGVPYLFAGVALTRFNPQAEMRGRWYDLRPLHTEGVHYSPFTLAVPFGFGMKFNISYKVNFGFEFGARKTFTDYLDDVSRKYIDVEAMQHIDPVAAALAYRTPELTGKTGENPAGQPRGNPANKDWYVFGSVTISVNLTDKYGLDFDPKYAIFKNNLSRDEKENTLKKHTNKSIVKKKRIKRRLFKKKKYIGPYIRKKLPSSHSAKTPKN